VVGLAGPYDFTLDRPLLRDIFGAAPDFRATQPISFASASAPPVLLVVGDADETVSPENSRSLSRHLAAAGSPVALLEVPGLDHMDVVLQLSWIWSRHGAIRDEIIRFLDDPDAVTR